MPTNEPPNPTPLTEDQFLDWIEDRLPASEQARLEQASGRAGLGQRIRQMKANRHVLRTLGTERAPAELIERVLGALERDALVGLADGENLSDEPPISMVEYTRRTRSWRDSAPRLAMAAGLLLVIGGATYWGSLMLQQLQRPAPAPIPGPVASEHASTPAMVASATPVSPAPSADAGAANVESVPAPVMLAMENAEISPARALSLARGGRLMVRVVAGGRTAAPASLLARTDRAWKLSGDVRADLVLATLPAPSGFVGPVVAKEGPELARALGDLIAPMLGPRAGVAGVAMPAPQTHSNVCSAYMLEAPATEGGLVQAAGELARSLGGRVVFEALPQSADPPVGNEASSMLWFTQDPGSWSPRISIPVVIEESEDS